jgi:hypothetical protein
MMSQANATIDIFSLAAEAELDLFQALRELSALHDLGLVDQRKLRLTMNGLIHAVRRCPEARRHAVAQAAVDTYILAVA